MPKLCADHEVINVNIKYIKESVSKIDKKLDNYIVGAHHEYSAKWVEKLATGVLSTVGVIIIGGILGLLFAPKAFAFGQSLQHLIS